ncbi:recombinase family protein [Glycomyces paridis]|nr:recombinase family protein [Glycomyces paridis]
MGRTSTDDLQDPTISIPRQLSAVRKALPPGAQIVAYYYDVESGRSDLGVRGTSTAHEKFDIPVPRTGGLKDLLQAASGRERSFDVVMCESIDRVARITYYSTRLEHELEQYGVALLAADEPIVVTRRKLKSATSVLTRRVKQGISEWYVLDLLEKSWGGFEAHAQQGFNVGKALYGYILKQVPHPVPAKRADGRWKTVLELEPVRAAVVKRIFDFRIRLRLGYAAIAERLNEDLALNPPPVPPDPTRARGSWCASSVREILRNPKYTGYMVWNRVTSTPKGNRPNPMSDWVWSPEPVHEAIVSPDMFTAAQQIAKTTERVRSKKSKTENAEEYRYRSAVRCDHCDLLMYGKRRENRIYYSCHPRRNARPEGHAAATYLNEVKVDQAMDVFLDSFILGAGREGRLQRIIDAAKAEGVADREAEQSQLTAALDGVQARRSKLIQVLEAADNLEAELITSVNERFQQLGRESSEITDRLVTLNLEIANQPDASVVASLPTASLKSAQVPIDLLRRLIQAFRIEIRYDPRKRQLYCTARISSTLLSAAQELIEECNAGPKSQRNAVDDEKVWICDKPRPGYCLKPMLTCLNGTSFGRCRSWFQGPSRGLVAVPVAIS